MGKGHRRRPKETGGLDVPRQRGGLSERYEWQVGRYLERAYPDATICQPDKEIPCADHFRRPDYLVLLPPTDESSYCAVFAVEAKVGDNPQDGESQISRETVERVVGCYIGGKGDVPPEVRELLEGPYVIEDGYIATMLEPEEFPQDGLNYVQVPYAQTKKAKHKHRKRQRR